MTNQLSLESSPYLLEHANNPVNWYAWKDEVFQLAKEQNKLIFVSVGYSACHWCHVMRHESFENSEVAKILNENFVSIKVDREERPDIDHSLQMSFQIMNGRGGGWPLSIFMTPDKKPFYSGTYFPLKSRYGMPGFIEVLNAVIKAYSTKLSEINSQAQKVEDYIKQMQDINEKNITSNFTGIEIIESFAESFDSKNGGFIGAPKFPSETGLYLLLHEAASLNNQAGLRMVFKTLDSMLQGGIYDQLGGGFHRYSVDEAWLVPHFEKMLYNQSLLVFILLEAYRVSKNTNYLEKSKEILEYVIREMKSKEGGFFSSQNADSEGVEGKYYVWEKKELKFLEKEELDIFCEYFDVTSSGNWEGKNVLHIVSDLDHLSKKYNRPVEEINTILKEAKRKVLEKRNKRIEPSTDTKMITSWNALMVKALILAYRVFKDKTDQEFAFREAKLGIDFIVSMIEGNSIYRICIDKKKSVIGFLDDFQYAVSSLLDFYEITLNEKYFSTALDLFGFSIENFYDSEQGSFFYSMVEHETIITRFKDIFDSPLPSPVAYALQNALRFSFFDQNKSVEFEKIVNNTLNNITLNPNIGLFSIATMILIKELIQNHYTEITISFSTENDELLKYINSIWLPFRLQIDINLEKIDLKNFEKEFLKGKFTNRNNSIYICKNFQCSLPLTSIELIKSYLQELYPTMEV